MTDLDKLERLVRLKESGGFTEEEFQAEKAKLLVAAQSGTVEDLLNARQNWWIIGGVFVASLLILLFLMPILQQRPSSVGSDNAVEGETIAAAMGDDVNTGAADKLAPSEALAKGSYAWATSDLRIGANPEYIEKVLGPPAQKDSNSLFYNELQGCIVNYITKGSKVTSIQIIITEKCTPEVNGNLITPQTTFGSIYDDFGFLMTSCLSMCGNKADPTIEFVIPGPHSSNFIDVRYSTYDTDGSTVWENEIARANGVTSIFDVPEGALRCPEQPTQAAVNAMKGAKVSDVTIGIDLEQCVEW